MTVIYWPPRRTHACAAEPVAAEPVTASRDARVDALCQAIDAEQASSGWGDIEPQPAPLRRPTAAELDADQAYADGYMHGVRDGRIAGFCWGLMLGGGVVAAAILNWGVGV